MPVVNVELNARRETVQQPIIWRLGRLFNVVTNIRRARVTEDYGYVLLEMEGSATEAESASTLINPRPARYAFACSISAVEPSISSST